MMIDILSNEGLGQSVSSIHVVIGWFSGRMITSLFIKGGVRGL